MSEQQQQAAESPAAATTTDNAPAQPTDSSNAPEAGDVNMSEGNNDDTAAIRAQVEKEHALADAQKKLRDLERDLEQAKKEMGTVEGEKDAAGMSKFLSKAIVVGG